MSGGRMQARRILARLISHSFEATFAALYVIIAVMLEVKHHHLGIGGVMQLPLALVIAWEWALLLGGACMVLGIVWPRSPSVGYGIERLGLYLTGGVWATEALVLVVFGGRGAVPGLLQAVAIVLGCAGRIIYTRKVETVAEQTLAADHRREAGR